MVIITDSLNISELPEKYTNLIKKLPNTKLPYQSLNTRGEGIKKIKFYQTYQKCLEIQNHQSEQKF